ncbi:peroxiredoxin [Sphingomonas jatrophae]|uniref:thioredoxin-dependent peroxiredoxin n=1 Tax=Sphingomonas jatrophae TaxID=1166337 RepID=A0A1I6JGW1_9SPHN|nr:peroxiredoxin [Sphingomonas jatrophae]SFR78089.1 peroxiredoxin Q/BCP [Sphingomonas jatrophae]
MLNEGDMAPEVTLTTPDGGALPLSSMRGHILVLYFYPKDDTSGCTKEAQDFSELKAAFEMEGAYILGVSKDPPASKTKFIDKYALRHTLASDTEGAACEAFGTWVEKSMYGRKYMGIDRATFLIDPEGRVVKAWRKVKVPGHADAVLKAVRALKTAEQNTTYQA